MNEDQNLVQTLLRMSGQKNVITLYRPFFEFTGSIEAALMFSQLLYWTPKAKEGAGWIAKTDAEFSDELCLSIHGVRTGRKTLKEMGVLKTKLKRFKGSPTTHYKLDINASVHKWKLWIHKNELVESQNGTFESTETLTETTIETTTDTPKRETEENLKPKPKSEYTLNMEHLEKAFAEKRCVPEPNWSSSNPKELNKRWRSPLKRMLALCSGDLDRCVLVMEKAITKMVNDGLILDAPASIEKNFNSLIADLNLQQKGDNKPNFTQIWAKERAEEHAEQERLRQQQQTT